MLRMLPVGGKESSVANEAVVDETMCLWAKEVEGEWMKPTAIVGDEFPWAPQYAGPGRTIG